MVAMRQPPRAAVAAAALLLWLAVLTVAFHGRGGRLGCGGLLPRRTSPVVAVPRKMLLAVTGFDAASPPPTSHHHHHRHHHPHQHHQAHHHHHHAARWNRHGIPPSPAGDGGEVDPRYGVEKRLVPTGPNPLHH